MVVAAEVCNRREGIGSNLVFRGPVRGRSEHVPPKEQDPGQWPI